VDIAFPDKKYICNFRNWFIAIHGWKKTEDLSNNTEES
jgi:hypothetical protein